MPQSLKFYLAKWATRKKEAPIIIPKEKRFFIGDYVDRGEYIRETLKIVRSMQENGDAIALMGNHEYNALCFYHRHQEGGHLRPHLIKNIIQHYKTLEAFHGYQKEYEDYLAWFLTLPLFYEDNNLRAVHACWNDSSISTLKEHLSCGLLSEELLRTSADSETTIYTAVDRTLKGIELKMPNGASYCDHEKNIRTEVRTQWWENPAEMTYRSISVEPLEELPETKIDLSTIPSTEFYVHEKPVFFGHYWMKGKPLLQKPNVCCVDYSVAKGGSLVAYRMDNEPLNEKNFVVV
jgi:hypothetical protein